MNLSNSIRNLIDKIETISMITEAKGHMDHPEDLVFLQGAAGADKAIDAIMDTVGNPQAITIKWDGYPALIWGYGNDGRFTIMDKHMFNKGTESPARNIHSPEEFMQYDINRGADRSNLLQTITKIWPELEQLTPNKKGYFWGDLLFDTPLTPEKDGMYHFQPNPNGISYTVEANSPVGIKYFKGKQAGIVVHQYLLLNAENTDDPSTKKSLNGTTGGMGEGKNVSILPAAMPQTPKLKINTSIVSKAKNTVSKYGPDLDEFIKNAPGKTEKSSPITDLLLKYINAKIRTRNLTNITNGFIQFVQEQANQKRISGKTAMGLLGYVDPNTNKPVPGYLKQNMESLKHVFEIWIAVYNLKMSVVPQLDKAAEEAPVQGYLQDGTRSQEGFVSHGVKLINRLGFSAQNLAGR